MVRLTPALIGLGLAVLWVIGMCEDAEVWLTWLDGVAATLSFAVVGLIPEREGSRLAAGAMGAVGLGLLALWLTGLATHATPWLTWWTFVAGCVTALAAGAV